MLTRRKLVAGSAILGGVTLAGALSWRRRYTRKLGPPLKLIPGKTQPLQLTAAERPTALPCFGGHTLPMWTFADGVWPPVVRLGLGERLNVMLENRLPRPDEYTSIHWHGCRLPNNQDGVPYLVQKPVLPGEKFHYNFMPPDTGTFFFHTHCNTAEQLGRGLQGVVIVDGDTTEPYDADIVLFIRDWHVDLATGQWNSFVTLRGAGRAGTYGPVRSVNGAGNPEFKLPASGDCRLRLINGDPTRVMQIAIEDGEAAILAIDGFAVQPLPFSEWLLGPAMRIDLVLRAPETRPRDSSTARSPASNLRISPAPANRARPPISIRNVAIEYRWAENHYDAIPGFLAELIARRVAVIALPDSTPGAIAAKGMTSTIPVVFEIFGDPVQLGLVNGWNRPGGNVTGIVLGNAEIVPKRMALIRELVPALTTLGSRRHQIWAGGCPETRIATTYLECDH